MGEGVGLANRYQFGWFMTTMSPLGPAGVQAAEK